MGETRLPKMPAKPTLMDLCHTALPRAGFQHAATRSRAEKACRKVVSSPAARHAVVASSDPTIWLWGAQMLAP